MATVLVQMLLAMAAAAVLGFTIGAAWARAREEGAQELTDARVAELEDDLTRAREDLAAHGVELADANGEIVALLADVHEARSARGASGAL